jgi:uncharacterized protein YlxW (UPF0749 family)
MKQRQQREDAEAPPVSRQRARGQIAIALTLALLGFLLATQLRSQQGLTQRLSIERESDLGQILTELTARSDLLSSEIVDLRVKLAEASGSQAQQSALIADARQQLQALQILLGVVPVKGQGIVMTFSDPDRTLGPDVLLDTVQELRDAGAEAIAISGVRVVASTAFTGVPGAMQVAGQPVQAPYVVQAIGPSSTLAEAMRIPGGVVDSLAADAGTSVRITEEGSVSILHVSALPRFVNARPTTRR